LRDFRESGKIGENWAKGAKLLLYTKPPKCMFEVAKSEWSATAAYALSTMSANCGTSGAAALASAQTANGISSGANTAAPAMVVNSTLVGALAIFA